MKFLFWDLGVYLGRVVLALLAGGVIAFVAAVLAFIFWDKADILREENKGSSSSGFLFWRILAVIIGAMGVIWGLSAFIDTLRLFF